MKERTYLAIDLKSFYASVECVDRGLDPLAVKLVVADLTRTEKTICLAVSPPLKAIGVPGRPRLFEVVQQVAVVNAKRKLAAPGRCLTGKSAFAEELKKDPCLAVDYIVAPPRMARYMEYSARIYAIYLRHVAPEDIHVYSVDEVFIDATDYIASLHCTARRFATQLILEILQETGITATAGIGSNLYLCKVAMDIVAKHVPPDSNGVRIAMLDEQSYRQQLWSYRPITDFWRVGPGYAKKLAQYGIFTMGDVARCSLGGPEKLHNEELLFRLFGVNAELLIDHAWGWEPSLELVEKGLVCSQFRLDIDYDTENLSGGSPAGYRGPVKIDRYGRKIPAPAHGSTNLETPVSSSRILMQAAARLFDQIAQPALSVRKITVTAAGLLHREDLQSGEGEQLDFFGSDLARRRQTAELQREWNGQQAIVALRKKYGKNAVLRGMDLQDGATAIARNGQVGGHRA